MKRLKAWWQTRHDWVAKRLDMDGPKEHGCITITVYETEPVKITFQFAGLNGGPMNPYLVYHVLGLVARAVERAVQPPQAGEPAAVPLTTESEGVLV